MSHKRKTRKELRKFGLVMAVPFSLIAGYLWWKQNGIYPVFLGLAAFFLVTGLVLPQVLRPIELVWMKVAELIGAVMTRVILLIAFYIIVTPLGLLLRILRKDLLQIRENADADSFWVPVETDGPAARPEKPF